jgi:hypothetical protein
MPIARDVWRVWALFYEHAWERRYFSLTLDLPRAGSGRTPERRLDRKAAQQHCRCAVNRNLN